MFDELAPRGDLYLSRSIDQTLLQGYESPGPGQYINGTESSQLLTSFGKGSTISNSEPTWKIGTSKRIMVFLLSSFHSSFLLPFWLHPPLSLSSSISNSFSLISYRCCLIFCVWNDKNICSNCPHVGILQMSAPRGSEGQPGPGAYSSPSSMGKQAVSAAHMLTCFAFLYLSTSANVCLLID